MTPAERDWLWAAGIIVVVSIPIVVKVLGAPYRLVEKLVLLALLEGFFIGLAAAVIYS
jgi:hypothetical protein